MSQWYGYLSLNRILLTWATCFPSGQTRSSWKHCMVFDRYLLTRKNILHFKTFSTGTTKKIYLLGNTLYSCSSLRFQYHSGQSWCDFLYMFVISYGLPILFIVCASLSSQAQVIVMHALHCSAWQYLYTFRLGIWMTSFMQSILWVFLLWAAIPVADFQSWTWRD